MSRTIPSRFPFVCQGCKAKFPEQTQGHYNPLAKRGQKMRCLACGPDKAPAPAPAPAPAATDELTRPSALVSADVDGVDVCGIGRTLDLFRIARLPARHPQNEQYREHYATRREPFTLDANVDDVEAAVLAPDPAHLASVAQLAEEELRDLPLPQRKRRRWVQAEAGSAVDLGRALAGDPLAWREQERRPAPRTVTIGVNWSAPWTVQADQLQWRGVATVALAYWLARRGVRSRILLCTSSIPRVKDPRPTVLWLEVSSPECPLDEASLATLLASKRVSAAAFRSCIFAVKSGDLTQPHGESLSGVLAMPESSREFLGIDYMVPGDCLDAGACRSWIRDAAAKVMQADGSWQHLDTVKQ